MCTLKTGLFFDVHIVMASMEGGLVGKALVMESGASARFRVPELNQGHVSVRHSYHSEPRTTGNQTSIAFARGALTSHYLLRA